MSLFDINEIRDLERRSVSAVDAIDGSDWERGPTNPIKSDMVGNLAMERG